MEAVKPPRGTKGKGKKTKNSKVKAQQIRPNPDEVIEIERPGSTTSVQSKASLFVSDGEQNNQTTTSNEERPDSPASMKVPSPRNRPTSPLALPFKPSQVAPEISNPNDSQISLRSRTSREAWKGEEIKPDLPKAPSSTNNKSDSALPVQNGSMESSGEISTTRSASTTNLLSAPKLKGEEQAYVPYLFARDTIVKIVNDMHKMRSNHIGAINQIELNYRMIEDETQRQFNSFVINLRNIYKDKLTVFQHIVTIHRKDIDKKQEHWDSNLSSLSTTNKKLLNDKRALLIQNKLLIDRLAEVREEERKELIGQIEALNLQIENQAKEHKDVMEREQRENEERVEVLNLEIEKLKANQQTGLIPLAAVVSTDEPATTAEHDALQTRAPAPQVITKEVVIDLSESERAELANERQRLSEEMENMTKQREILEQEREEFIKDRKQLNDEKNKLQQNILETERGIAEWKGKYEVVNTQVLQFKSLRSDYDTLLAAYNAVVIAASNTGEADAKLEKSQSDKASLEEDKKGLENDIANWEKEFKANTGKNPTENDYPDSIKEYKVMLEETDNAIKQIDVEVDTIMALKKGEAPPPPQSSPEAEKARIPAEPVIKLVEVKVPDPDVVAKLEASDDKNDKLQKENSNLQIKIDTLQVEIAKLKEHISDVEVDLKKAEAENNSNAETIALLQSQLKSSQITMQAGEDGDVTGTSLAADHSDSQERIQELEEKVDSLEEQLLAAQLDITDADPILTSSGQVDELQTQVDELDEKLRQQLSGNQEMKDELDNYQQKVKDLEDQLEAAKKDQDDLINTATLSLNSQVALKEKELKAAQTRVADLEAKMMENVPVDVAAEMKKLLKKIASLSKENEGNSKKAAEMETKSKELETEKASLVKEINKAKQTNSQIQAQLKSAKEEKEKEISKINAQWDKKEKARVAENKAKVEALNKKIKELESRPAAAVGAVSKGKSDAADQKSQKQITVLTEQLQAKKKENKELQAKILQIQEEVKKAKSEGGGDLKEQKKMEKNLKDMSKKLEMETKKAERDGAKVKELEAELAAVQKDRDSKGAEVKKLKADIDQLGVTAAQALELGEKVQTLEEEVKNLNKEAKKLADLYQTERVQRKKYFNMVEDMKGKIRVYCRARPMSKNELDRGNFSVLQSTDEYSINVESSRGLKEFNFDRVFMPENTQDQVFEDTYHLIQSAVDGYNVCIFAYGQTGSGKTFTMIGDREQKFPGIAPRAFGRIFEVIEENKEKFTFNVSSYMLELYNDKLLDLYGGKDSTPDDKMDIKKDKAGMVFVKGAIVKDANTEKALYTLFEEGSKNRHTASTKMNDESSRSHLVLSVIIEATNKLNGQVTKGKLSLVDLAGSERVGKTGASAETLKEANSINKSLAALGDVISALSSDQQFIPYRNNKLTMLMQDSLGGNAKTLMFVNISPADYNADETVTSLTYASRVKLITNDAQKNQDNKEIARLKGIIALLKSGETVEVDED